MSLINQKQFLLIFAEIKFFKIYYYENQSLKIHQKLHLIHIPFLSRIGFNIQIHFRTGQDLLQTKSEEVNLRSNKKGEK